MNRKICILIGIVCSILCIGCVAIAFWPKDEKDPIQEMVELQNSTIQQESESVSYNSPIDFEKIQKENPDIYAWIDLPDTQISYPLLQREEDNDYYLSHDSSGKAAEAGAIFTQSTYNSRDFKDPVTLVYGHRMRSGSRFGRLQEIFSDEKSFKEHKEMVVYLPECELRFDIFAAVPYNNKHIMSDYDFNNRKDYKKFLDTIYDAKGLFREEISVTPDDQLLILSTCLKWDSTGRYLVLGKLRKSDDSPVATGSHINQ